MKTETGVILAEMDDMHAIVNVARSLEAAERGEPVSRHDIKVQLRAAEIVLELGSYLRSRHSAGFPKN